MAREFSVDALRNDHATERQRRLEENFPATDKTAHQSATVFGNRNIQRRLWFLPLYKSARLAYKEIRTGSTGQR